MIYRLLQRFLRFLLGVFYRQIEVVGLENVPMEGEGAVLFCGNHPNSLLDPALIIAFGGRIVHFAAKDVLFRSRLLSPILSQLGAVPVARRADHGTTTLDNDAAFLRMYEVLAQGRAVGIFPEGLSHDFSQIQRLKTGAARIALGTLDQHPNLVLHVIPCGLHYVRRKRFRTRVLIQFGQPILVSAATADPQKDPKQAARDLTAQIEQGLRALTVNAEDWEVLRVLDGVRRLYQPPGISLQDRIELARRFNAVYPTIKDHPEVAALYIRVHEYLERLRTLHLTDRDLRRIIGPAEAFWRILRHLLLLFVFVPLFLPGALIHLPLGLFIGWAGLYFAPRKDVIATTKFMLGLLLMLFSFLLILGLIGWTWGPLAALLASVLMPLSGYATLVVLERGVALRRSFVTLVRLASLRTELVNLRKERQELQQAVIEAVERFRPKDMAPLIAPDRGLGIDPV